MKGAMFAVQLHNPVDFPVTSKLSVSEQSEWLSCSCKSTKGTDVARQFFSLQANCLNNHRWPGAKIEKVAQKKVLAKTQ
jgi:hypothetical protein